MFHELTSQSRDQYRLDPNNFLSPQFNVDFEEIFDPFACIFNMSIVTIGSILNFFENNKALDKGENSLSCNYIIKCNISVQNDKGIILADAEVRASMKNKTYNVSVSEAML